MRTRMFGVLATVLVAAACGGGGDAGARADSDVSLVDALAVEFEEATGLTSEDARCASSFVVDEIGEAELRAAGFPDVDEDTVDAELTGRIGRATVDALEACEVDLADIATGDVPLGDVEGEWELVDPNQSITTVVTSELVVVDAGFSTYEWGDETWATAAATLRNDGAGDGARVEVTMTLRAADGTPLATETAIADYVPPGGEAHVSVDFWEDLGDDEPVEVDVEVDDQDFPSEGAVLAVRIRHIELDAGSATIRGSVANPTDQRVAFASIHCVLIGDDGIVGGLDGGVEPIAPGSDVAFEVSDSFGEGFDANAADCTAGVSF